MGQKAQTLTTDIVHCCHRKLPIWWENMGLILNMSRVIVNLVLEFPNFHYHSNRGWCDTNFTYTVTLAYPLPLLWCKNHRCISITSWVIANFPLKFANFCYHGNKGQSGRRLNAQH